MSLGTPNRDCEAQDRHGQEREASLDWTVPLDGLQVARRAQQAMTAYQERQAAATAEAPRLHAVG